MSEETMRYLGGCTWLLRCVRPSCCTCMHKRAHRGSATCAHLLVLCWVLRKPEGPQATRPDAASVQSCRPGLPRRLVAGEVPVG
jgi:hypothetical protein